MAHARVARLSWLAINCVASIEVFTLALFLHLPFLKISRKMWCNRREASSREIQLNSRSSVESLYINDSVTSVIYSEIYKSLICFRRLFSPFFRIKLVKEIGYKGKENGTKTWFLGQYSTLSGLASKEIGKNTPFTRLWNKNLIKNFWIPS